jgi:hypothetical protein
MVPQKYQLGAVGRFLLEQFELRRPGLKAVTPEVEESFRRQAEAEIAQMERQLHELGLQDAQYWQRVRRVVDEILLPRYLKLAQERIDLAERDYGIWRGGDLIARAAFAAIGLVLGILCVELPYIPIQARWFPVLPFVVGPLFPDVVVALHSWSYRKKLEGIVEDLSRASDALETYRPLSELTKALEMPADLAQAPASGVAQAPADVAEAPAVPSRERS